MRVPGTGSSISSSGNCKDGGVPPWGVQGRLRWTRRVRFRFGSPRLPHYTRYHRILRNAERLVAELALSVLPDNQVHLIDSKPLPVANPKSPYPQRGTPALGLEGQLVLGDKAYIGTAVLTPKRSNMTRSSSPKNPSFEAVLVGPWGSNGAWSESLDQARTRSSNEALKADSTGLVRP